MRERAPLLVLAFCLLLFSGRALSSLVQESATFDETSYFGLGRYLLENQRWDVRGSILHPPLSFYLQSLPLLFADIDTSVFGRASASVADPAYLASADVSRGQALLSSPANRGDRLLTASRLVMVAIGALLGWFVYAWSYALYGPWSAMLAIVLYTFCPNILAHSRLITPDITVTTFSFVSVYLLWRLLRENLLRYAVAGGVCLGLALLAKFTGALLIPRIGSPRSA
jgi:4-amino-4-deoxy-L-arabinose transferase-like glycosyltransferase